MSLSKTTLATQLRSLPLATSLASAVESWYVVWWTYARVCAHLLPDIPADPGPPPVPGTVTISDAVCRTAFKSALTPAMLSISTPTVFFNALQTAQLAAWAVLSNPIYLIQQPLPIIGEYTRSAIVPTLDSFSDPAQLVVPIGLAELTSPNVPMDYLAETVHTWTLKFTVTAMQWQLVGSTITLVTVPPLPFS